MYRSKLVCVTTQNVCQQKTLDGLQSEPLAFFPGRRSWASKVFQTILSPPPAASALQKAHSRTLIEYSICHWAMSHEFGRLDSHRSLTASRSLDVSQESKTTRKSPYCGQLMNNPTNWSVKHGKTHSYILLQSTGV